MNDSTKCDLCGHPYSPNKLWGILVDECSNVNAYEYTPYRSCQIKLCNNCVNGIAMYSTIFWDVNDKILALKAAIKDITE